MAPIHSHGAIARLLVQQSWKDLRIGKQIRLLCSHVKKAEHQVKRASTRRKIMSKEKRAEAVESFVKQYMVLHPGKFPTGKLVRTEVGGRPSLLREILAKLKTTLRTAHDQKQEATDNGVVSDSIKFSESECLGTDTKPNKTVDMENNELTEETLPSFKKLSVMNLPDNQQDTPSQSSKEEPGALPVAADNLLHMSSTESAGKKVERIASEKEEFSAIPSHTKGLSAATTSPRKLQVEQTTGEGTPSHAQGVIQSPEVEISKVEGNDIPENTSFLSRLARSGEMNDDTSMLEQIKQLGQDQRHGKFPSTSSFLSRSISDDEKEDDSDFAAFDYPEPDAKDRPVIPRTNFRLDMLGLSARPKEQHCLFVMFLPISATEHDLRMAFSDCGSIAEVQIIPSRRENSRFNYASVNFKTEEGFRKAIMKKDIVVRGADVVVRAASSSNQNLHLEFRSRGLENLALPPSEIKNPGCTVMIRDLPNGLHFRHLKNALAFCGTVSSFSMGSSNSIVYIEFETEDAKERALMTHWVSVDGHQLQIRRIDPPRTPVVRISNVSPETSNTKILNICESFGRVKKVDRRHVDIADVHFRQTELRSMLGILDRLNGVIMDQCHWQAQPAPVFPPETLQALWSSADGREHLHMVMQNLCRIISRDYVETNDVNELAAQYYEESISRTKGLYQ